ncbi:hypothetical protein F3Y22_tig00109926pilonHSYRG00065 [Hibiscus syriacus]|uniref:Uncharacterized protein n=1 Tax=Hibiscus syriacus TaxID=106335 RepID=A0A6A3BUN8_HIBSY|nr:hypothetical protein F3Y22_tig00109926pilonHSYRG00065 [Hibiscus syriacus]
MVSCRRRIGGRSRKGGVMFLLKRIVIEAMEVLRFAPFSQSLPSQALNTNQIHSSLSFINYNFLYVKENICVSPMMHFSKLEDTPMFRQEIQCVEENAELMRGRSLKFYEGCRKTRREGLQEGHSGDIAFVSALETFGGDQNDPTCVAFGGCGVTFDIVTMSNLFKQALNW